MKISFLKLFHRKRINRTQEVTSKDNDFVSISSQADGKATRSQAVSYSYVIPIRELALPSKSSCNNIGIEFLVLHASLDSVKQSFLFYKFLPC